MESVNKQKQKKLGKAKLQAEKPEQRQKLESSSSEGEAEQDPIGSKYAIKKPKEESKEKQSLRSPRLDTDEEEKKAVFCALCKRALQEEAYSFGKYQLHKKCLK